MDRSLKFEERESETRLLAEDSLAKTKVALADAEAMRRILIEDARRHAVRNPGGVRRRINADDFSAQMTTDPNVLLDLDEGLTQLAAEDTQAAELVKLRLFAGHSVAKAGDLLGLSRTGAYRNWEFVRSWFAVWSETPAD